MTKKMKIWLKNPLAVAVDKDIDGSGGIVIEDSRIVQVLGRGGSHRERLTRSLMPRNMLLSPVLSIPIIIFIRLLPVPVPLH